MSDVQKGILGVIQASLKYFSSVESSLSDNAKKHISKKSQDQKSELEECKYTLQQLQDKLRLLEEEKFRIEAESGRINLKKNKLVYYNTEYKNEIFTLQKELFEIESNIGNVLALTPRQEILNKQESYSQDLTLPIKGKLTHKNYQSRIAVSQSELEKAQTQIKKLEVDLHNETRILDNLTYQLSTAICDKKQLLLDSKKHFDEKYKNFSIRLPRRSLTYK